ncbi:MAG TPA: FumA C-terminus/TtdB family hydratase beta subunit [Thermodesulfovibrionales bacterium]|nr:FumA C-terminus/TtdB family hydratase beta subunit [Thermodesulfovibrionales bacterium]
MKEADPKRLRLPLTREDVLSLRAGDEVLISGRIVTGRDKLHKFLVSDRPSGKQMPVDLEGTILYHCGPIVKKSSKGYEIVACGPTTSMRVEMYEPVVISEYGLRGIMGKGGMGPQTLRALREYGCVYLHAIGGAAVYLAQRVKRVAGVWKLEEFGMAEAMWILEVEDFPAIVTMDSFGESLHGDIERKSSDEFRRLIGLV